MKIKNILVSQPKPVDISKTHFESIIKKYNVKIDFEKFIKLEGVEASELRQDHVKLTDYTAIILTSRNAVDHFFRIAKEMRYTVPDDLKYFCVNESTALYLQHYIQFRKRKIFYGNQTFADLVEIMKKHREETFFLPTSNIVTSEDYGAMMTEAKLNFKKSMLFRTVPSDLKDIDITKYDMLVFFSPAGIDSLKINFPDFVQGEVAIGALGAATAKAVTDAGFNLSLSAPTKTAPSITMAIEEYLEAEIKKAKTR